MNREEIEQLVRETLSFHYRYNVSQEPKRGRGRSESVSNWLLPDALARLTATFEPDEGKQLKIEDRVFLSLDGGAHGWLIDDENTPYPIEAGGEIPGYDIRESVERRL